MADDKNTNPPVSDPEDEENVVIDTTSTEPLRNAKIEEPPDEDAASDEISSDADRGTFRAPKFGSAGSGGAELEPGPGRGPDRS
jgi:hypothetical protein